MTITCQQLETIFVHRSSFHSLQLVAGGDAIEYVEPLQTLQMDLSCATRWNKLLELVTYLISSLAIVVLRRVFECPSQRISSFDTTGPVFTYQPTGQRSFKVPRKLVCTSNGPQKSKRKPAKPRIKCLRHPPSPLQTQERFTIQRHNTERGIHAVGNECFLSDINPLFSHWQEFYAGNVLESDESAKSSPHRCKSIGRTCTVLPQSFRCLSLSRIKTCLDLLSSQEVSKKPFQSPRVWKPGINSFRSWSVSKSYPWWQG